VRWSASAQQNWNIYVTPRSNDLSRRSDEPPLGKTFS